MKNVWTICGGLLLSSCMWCLAQNLAAPKPLSPQEQALVDVEKSLIAAKMHDDGAFFKRSVAANFEMVGVDGQLLEGEEAIDNLGDSDLADLAPYDMEVVFAGEDTAIVTYDAVVLEKTREDQGPPPRYQHFSSVWVKQGDAWKLKFQQVTATKWGDW